MGNTAIEKRARRRLAKDGQMLNKIREDSPWYQQYGPYTVSDMTTNTMVAWGIEDLEAYLDED